MPESGSPLAAAGIVASANLLESGINAASQGSMNRKNREFAVQMYDRQRADALADRDFQNEYSSPAAQMKRLIAAGLNPNLVYGNGAGQSVSAPTRASSYSAPDTKAPQVRLGAADAVSAFYDAKLKNAQTDNVKALTEVAAQTAALTVANIAKSHAETTKLKADTMQTGATFGKTIAETLKVLQDKGQSAAQFPLTQEKLRSEIDKINADKQFTLDQNQRAAALNSKTIEEATSRILKMEYENAKTDAERRRVEVEISNLAVDNQLKHYDLILKAAGAQPGDNLFMRLLGKWIHDHVPSVLPNY